MFELGAQELIATILLFTLGPVLLVLFLLRPKPPSPEHPAAPAPTPLQELTQAQRTSNKPLDQVLMDLGLTGEREALQRKAQELGFGFVDLDRVTLDAETLKVVPLHLVKLHRVIPVKRQDTTLWLAMSNPASRQAIEDVGQATGCRVIPVIAVPNAIEESIAKYYEP